MHKGKGKVLVAFLSIALVSGLVAACSSSGGNKGNAGTSTGQSGSAATSPVSGSQTTLKIGLLSDFTGIASSSFADTKDGTDAYINYINSQGGVNGQKIQIVEGDTQSSPTGAISAAQKLVEQDHVFAILENTSFFFAVEDYLLKKGIPVVGSAIDGTEWADPKYTNIFAASGINNPNYYPLATGQFMKNEGATSCAAVGNSGVPSVAQAAKAFMASCKAAGLKDGYTNLQLPLGSTDVGPIALAIKNSGADAIYLEIVANSAFALITALHQIGAKPKVVMVLSGYGSDLLSQPATVQAGQGVYFSTFGIPAEVHNPGTDLRRELMTKVGAKSPPTAGQQYGYLIAVAFVAGLKAAGANPTQQGFISAMRGITDFDGNGLLPTKVNFGNYTPSTSCMTVVKLQGNAFVPQNPMPLCAGTAKLTS